MKLVKAGYPVFIIQVMLSGLLLEELTEKKRPT